MMDFQSLRVARSKTSDIRSNRSTSAYDEAIEILGQFKIHKNITLLEKAARKLIESLEFNKEHIHSYFLLSYIFYALDNHELALKYFKKGEELYPFALPGQLSSFKNKILQYINYNPGEESPPVSQFKTTHRPGVSELRDLKMPAQAKVVVPKTSSFWKGLTGK